MALPRMDSKLGRPLHHRLARRSRLIARARMVAHGRLFGVQRCFKIGTGSRNDLLAKFCLQLCGFDFLHRAVVKLAQIERPKCDTDQPVHLQAEIFKNLAYLAVLALANADSEPDVCALLTIENRFDGPVSDAINGHSLAKLVECFLPHAPERARGNGAANR